MASAAYVSLQLMRFDSPMKAASAQLPPLPGTQFLAFAADTLAAGSDPAQQTAYVFAQLGLHAEEASAHAAAELPDAGGLPAASARELYRAVLKPYRHKGMANYLDAQKPGALFAAIGEPAPLDKPLVTLTTAGWTLQDEMPLDRIQQFMRGLQAVRISMTAIKGLHSQQTFFFLADLGHDSVTLSFWQNEPAMAAWAYAPGVHRQLLERDRSANRLSDRMSFTRLRRIHSAGTWYGVDPLAG